MKIYLIEKTSTKKLINLGGKINFNKLNIAIFYSCQLLISFSLKSLTNKGECPRAIISNLPDPFLQKRGNLPSGWTANCDMRYTCKFHNYTTLMGAENKGDGEWFSCSLLLGVVIFCQKQERMATSAIRSWRDHRKILRTNAGTALIERSWLVIW